VQRRWELFSRDTSYPVYLAAHEGKTPLDAAAVQQAASQVLPVAPALHYETLPVVIEPGTWLVSVASWVLPLRLDAPPGLDTGPRTRTGDLQAVTQEKQVRAGGAAARRGSPPRTDAVPRVQAYFQRNVTARLAMAYHYQEYIVGRPGPQPVPMMDVVVALDLSGEGAVSDYKKLLQGLIWEEAGHQRELAEFLLRHGLLTLMDLEQARRAADANERSGKSEQARRRLKYRPRPAK
jgi:hypothetical protein